MERIVQGLQAVPWVEIRRSSGGLGYHLYIYFADPIPCTNHTVHQNLAHAVLRVLDGLVEVDLQASIDVCGGNFWVWKRDEAESAYEVVKPATEQFPTSFLPHDWRERPEKEAKTFRGEYPAVEAGAELNEFFDHYQQTGGALIPETTDSGEFWKVHTVAVKKTLDAHYPHIEFETCSPGTNLANPNAFIFATQFGFRIVRYGRGTCEHAGWNQDGIGWTTKEILLVASWDALCRGIGGEASSDSTRFFLQRQSWEALGDAVGQDLPEVDRKVAVTRTDNGIVAKVDGKVEGFNYTPGSRVGELVIEVAPESFPISTATQQHAADNWVRATATPNGDTILDYYFKRDDDRFVKAQLSITEKTLVHRGFDSTAVKDMMGAAAVNAWPMKDAHFKPTWDEENHEYNAGAQLAAEPTPGLHPHTDEMFAHIGKYLDDYTAQNAWCLEQGVDGQRWIWLWVASMFQQPQHPLPLLFLYSDPEDSCGKSTFLKIPDLAVQASAGGSGRVPCIE